MKKMIAGLLVCGMVVFGMSASAMAGSNVLSPGASANDVEANATIGNVAAGAAALGGNQNMTVNLNQPAADTRGVGQQTINSNGHGYRGFPEGANINYPGMPSSLGGITTKGPQIFDITKLIKIQPIYDAEMLENMDDTGWGDIEVMETTFRDVSDAPLPDEVKAQIEQVQGATVVSFIAIRGTDSDVSSVDLYGYVMNRARKMGADRVQYLDQGPEIVMDSSGWGIGFNTTMATISSSEGTGTLSGGGTGYSSGTAGYQARPWLQFFTFRTVE